MDINKEYKAAKHPAADLAIGQTTLYNGVVIGIEPKIDISEPLVAGVSLELAKKLSIPLGKLSLGNLDKSEFLHEHKRVAKVRATEIGKPLGASKRTALENLYTGVIDDAYRVAEQLKNNQIKLKEAQEKSASLLSKFLLKEMKILSGNTKAQKIRYKNLIGYRFPTSSAFQSELTKSLAQMVSGQYLERDKKIIMKNQDFIEREVLDRDPGSLDIDVKKELYKASFEYPYFFPHPNYVIGRVTDYTYEYEYFGDPITVGYEVRIFSSEHSVVSDDVLNNLENLSGISYSSFVDDFKLVHVSVISGIWKIIKRHCKRRKITASGSIVEEKKYTHYTDVWEEWSNANGCASWIYPEDTLHLRLTYGFSTKDYARKFANGQTAAGDGKRYPIRACAYSVGMWGVHWLCHQNANAFTLRKWGFCLNDYPTNIIFGCFGDYPGIQISRRKDPLWQYEPLRGGIPGNQLYYHIVPPYGGMPEYLLMDALMDGGGYNLDEVWNANKNRWKSTHADYNRRSVPFEGSNVLSVMSPGWS